LSAPAISGRTTVLAIVGDPLGQARTPALVNAALAARGLDAVLVALHVPREALRAVVDGLRAVRNFAGTVVTMPHKSAVAGLLDDLAPAARRIGAVNVARREAQGRLVGTMLDGEGFVAGLRRAGHEVRNRRVFLAGAGGAAGAIAFALAEHGAAALTIHNRTATRAEALVARVGGLWPALDVRRGDDPAGHDLVVNATSLGMRDDDALPIDPARLGPGMLVAEVVIRPAPTLLLAEAARGGAATHGGETMLQAQVDLMIDFMLPWQDPTG
jgi:shikimate dehydrogenase